MSEHNNTPGNSLDENKGKDNKLGIGIKAEAENFLKQCNETGNENNNIFPFEVFPPPVQKIITATNESLNFPIDFIGTSMLYAVSVAIGNTYKV